MALSRRAVTVLRAALVTAGAMPWAFALLGVHHPAVYAAFAGLCHQRPERTLVVLGAPMAVCSRCAGLYAGAALGALVPLPARLVPYGRALVIAAVVAATVDVVTQDVGLHPPWHPSRVVTGLLMGLSAGAFFAAVLLREAAGAAPRDG